MRDPTDQEKIGIASITKVIEDIMESDSELFLMMFKPSTPDELGGLSKAISYMNELTDREDC